MSAEWRRWLRWTASVVTGLVLAGAVFFVYLRIFAGTVSDRAQSPDGKVTAEVRTLGWAAATDADFTDVQLTTRFNPFPHAVFGGLNYGAQIKVSWTNSENLVIQCVDCENLGDQMVENNWKGVTIHYELLSSQESIDRYLKSLEKSQEQEHAPAPRPGSSPLK